MQHELAHIGLTDNQAKIYLKLLKENEATASKIAKISGINRSTTYQELESLVQKGLVSYIYKNNNTRHYNAASPEKLLEILDAKRTNIVKILPDLKKLQTAFPSPVFHVEIYEGKEGIKTFYQHILNTQPKEVLAFGVTGLAFEVLQYSFPQFLNKYMKAGIKARYLANFDAKKRLNALPKSSVKIKYLSNEYNASVTTVIFDEFVAIQSLIKENVSVIIIKDKNLANSYKKYFEFMWNVI